MKLFALLLALVSLRAENWQKINAGPYEIYTSGDIKAAKNLLGTLEQMRGQLSDLTGITELKTIWPVRLVIAKTQRATNLTETASAYSMLLSDAVMTTQQKRQILSLLLATNAGPLEPGLEDALLTVLSSIESERVRVTLGALPPKAQQTPDWTLVEYLITNDAYRGRIRVFLSNVMKGTDKPTALRNAFEKDEATLRKEAAEAKLAPVTYPARTILPDRDYRARDVDPEEANLQLAIAQLSDPNLRARACLATKNPECLAAAAALSGNAEQAAIEASQVTPPTARSLYLAAVGQPDRLKHQQNLFTSLQLKPLYPDAALAFASKENDPMKAFHALKTAAPAAPRDARYQMQLAKAAQAAEQYADEAKAWAAAERAAFDGPQKEALRQARLGAQDRRYEAEALARKEAEEARLRDIERVKQESLRRVREAEAKARGNLAPLDPGTKVEPWWDADQPTGTLSGSLTRVDCLSGGKARFVVRDANGRLSFFEVDDPAKLILSGAGAKTFHFSCGIQRPARKIKAGHKDKKLITMELLP
ncbi:hypothetical protein [Bryobacter aggregatus]|uniref:hypothetical protein n=1 Tax=Bryobacter aggregatus TaxID=360054 RepID=UPI0012BA5817|nr:hypothetical protein [Bryobacter aggregatus]